MGTIEEEDMSHCMQTAMELRPPRFLRRHPNRSRGMIPNKIMIQIQVLPRLDSIPIWNPNPSLISILFYFYSILWTVFFLFRSRFHYDQQPILLGTFQLAHSYSELIPYTPSLLVEELAIRAPPPAQFRLSFCTHDHIILSGSPSHRIAATFFLSLKLLNCESGVVQAVFWIWWTIIFFWIVIRGEKQMRAPKASTARLDQEVKKRKGRSRNPEGR